MIYTKVINNLYISCEVHYTNGVKIYTSLAKKQLLNTSISQIKNLNNVYLYTIDDLGEIIEKNYKIREKSIKEAEEIIKFKIIEYKNWLAENSSAEIIKNYREYGF